MSHGTPEVQSALEGRYAIQRELGHGGMATVYLAQDLKLHRLVALKVLRPELGATLGPDRFLREIEIAARLSHPHILPLHDSGDAGGHLYYAMPYVEGESLRQKLEREGQLPVPEVIAILQAVAAALSYAQQHGIVHRDIKPENILLAKNQDGGMVHPLVADFGIARALDVAGGERLTETGLALGTPAYMSPEQAAASTRLDGRSDIYALGCVAYEMLAGSPPFTGPTAQSILARHAVDPPPPLHTVRSTVPPSVEAAIEQALAKVPADRFATADEFARALTAKHVPLPLRRRPLSRRVKVAVILSAAAASGLGAILLGRPAGSTVVPSATTMAVLPFFAAVTDTALTRLGRDLAVTLSASLDGIGGIETADRLAVANATSDRAALSAAESAALAWRLGSRSFLRGTLVRAGDNVRLDLGLYSSQGLAPLAEGITVTAHRDSIGTLTDSASWALLRQVWQRGDPPSPSLDAVTTRSVPALRAFLQGEGELGANRWAEAKLAYGSAIAADSAFWMAHFRYALTRFWTEELDPIQPAEFEGLRRYRARFPERERLLIDAFLTTGNTPRLKIERYGAAARRFADYWPAWFLYADALYHWGPIDGHDWSEGLEAFNRVTALNPKLVPAWEHTFDLTLGRDQAKNAEAFATLTRLGWLESAPLGGRLISRLRAASAGGHGMWRAADEALADSLAGFMCCGTRAVPVPASNLAVEFEPLFLLQDGFPAAQFELNRRALMTGKMNDRIARMLRMSNAWSWAARGQWDSALTGMSEIAMADGRWPAMVASDHYGMAVLGAWLGATPPALAHPLRSAAQAAIERLPDDPPGKHARARLAWFDGLLGFTQRDRRAIATARRAASESGWWPDQLTLVDRSLAAFDRALAGDRKRAGGELAALEEHCIQNQDCNSWTPHIAIQRLAAAQWLAEAGDLDRAARLLNWYEAPWTGWISIYRDALGGPTYLARARIEESLGRDSLAQAYYAQFLRRYDRPMPSQLHLVQEAKDGLARLQRSE